MKITKATFKSFIRKNQDNLYIKSLSSFNRMSDMVERSRNSRWVKPTEWLPGSENTLGLCGIWLVGSSRDRFAVYDDGEFRGIKCWNCCGSFVVGVKINNG